jgi:serine protease Do
VSAPDGRRAPFDTSDAPPARSGPGTSATEDGLAAAAAALRASVVEVHADGGGGGAGIAWRPGGLIVTSAHVVQGPRVTVVLPDARAVSGEVVRRDGRRDLALILAPLASLPAARTADPRSLRPGSLLFAVGHPLGVREAVSMGLLQATGALPPALRVPRLPPSLAWVQADLRLAPGNSGGPVADAEGRVVGVAAMVVMGIALAVPAPEVEAFVSGASSGRETRDRRAAFV